MNRFVRKSLGAFFAMVLLSNSILADDVRKTMEVSVNPLLLAIGYLPVNFRIAVANKMALGLHAYGHFFALGKTSVYGGGGGISTKFFLSGTAISDSWYVQPEFDAGFSRWGSQGFWTVSPSVIAGYTWVWDSGFLINLGLGAQYRIAFIDKDLLGKDTFGVSGILPTGEFSLGWAW